MTVDRFRPVVPIENVLIVTNVQYKELVMKQIPDLQPSQVLCEPARRNTAPCIAYATAHIKGVLLQRAIAEGKMAQGEVPDISNPLYDANIVVAPSDHLILQEQAFRQTIENGLSFVEKNDAILTLGMKPTRPETGYGYIQMQNAQDAMCSAEAVCKVKTFTEKPNLELAKVFMESGEFLWNSGIFLWNLRTIYSAFHSFLPEIVEKFREGYLYMGTDREDDFIQRIFPTCPNISIDYGVMEKAQNVFVLPSDFGWSDLGTWGSLYELSDKDDNGNVTLHSEASYYDSHRNIVTMESGKLAVIQGLDDMIVAEQGNVLLICHKSQEQQIRQFVNDANDRYNGQFN